MSKTDVAGLIAARLPKVFVARNFLDPADHAELIQDTLASEMQYKPSQVAQYHNGQLKSGVVNPDTRTSGRRSLSRPLLRLFKQSVLDRQQQISKATGVPFPRAHQFEIEAVHSGDGAFFAPHIDTSRGRRANYRTISAVYYYNHAPQRFSGGELKLYSLDQTASVVVKPEDNMMVFFPSIFCHEVLPVSVPSGKFDAARFSVNCWVHRKA